MTAEATVPRGDGTAPPELSVIIPVYDVEGYIAPCLESVLADRTSPIEVLCVDDGSTDRSGELLALAAARDPRLRVLRTPNRGPSAARNVGIDAATGRHLCFLDADDRMVPRACETILAAFGATDADVVTYGARAYPAFWAPYWVDRALSPRDVVYEGFEADLLFAERSHPFAWRTACRRDFLLESGVRFDEALGFGEDQVFLFELYPRSGRTALISDRLVSYRVSREGSLMDQRSDDPVRRIAEHIEAVGRILDDWGRHGILEGLEQPLFDWIVEFVGVDVLSLDRGNRTVLAHRLREVLESHLGRDFLEAQTSDRVHGFMVAALLADDGDSFVGTPQGLRLRYYGARDGWPSTFERTSRNLRTGLRERMGALAETVAGLRGTHSRRLREEAAWQAADAELRAQSTARLREGGDWPSASA